MAMAMLMVQIAVVFCFFFFSFLESQIKENKWQKAVGKHIYERKEGEAQRH